MAAMAMLLGFGTTGVQAQPAGRIVEVHTAAPNVIVAVVQTDVTYEYGTNSAADDVDANAGPNHWQVNGGSPAAIHRYSIPWDELRMTQGAPDAHPYSFPVTTRHRIYLVLSSALVDNTTYSITTPTVNGVQNAYGSTNWTFSSTNSFCESIKVNQVGYSKLNTSRFANFGVYMGDGGSMQVNPLHYKVYKETTSEILTNGTAISMWDDTSHASSASSGEYVYRLSLNAVPEGGPYYVSVDGAGRSRSFGIGDNYSSNIAYVTMRGLYLHRCGIALTEPYTAFTHAICHTNIYDVRTNAPDDAVFVDTSRDQPMFIQGGYHSAGDFDQWQNLDGTGQTIVSSMMLSFFEAFPDRFITNQYNIPESTNGTPDFLNEIMWGVKFWEYMQVTNSSDPRGDYGGVRAGTAPLGDPYYGYSDAANDGIWDPATRDVLNYGTYAVTSDCTAMAAGIFAQASRLIRPYPGQAAHANSLSNQAQLAWSYLVTHTNVHEARVGFMYAALQLYLLTGDANYRNIFETAATNVVINQGRDASGNPFFSDGQFYHPGDSDAACKTAHFISYLLPNGRSTDSTLAQNLKNNILYYARNGADQRPWPEDQPYPQGVMSNMGWGSGTGQGAYAEVWMYGCLCTNDPGTLQLYTNAVAQYADFPLGLNAMNMSYYTGLGTDQPNSPCACNSYYTKYGVYDGVPLPNGKLDYHTNAAGLPIGNVPGICIYGPSDGMMSGSANQMAIWKKVWPAWSNLPPQHRFAQGHDLFLNDEYSIAQPMTQNLLMYAFLYTPPGGGGGPPAPPAAPSNLSATGVSSSEIDLSWQDNSGNETGFKIERKTAGGTYAQIATASANATSYNNTGLAPGTTYYYRVRANNAVGDSSYSIEANATTATSGTPAAPSNLSATGVSSSQINLSWTDNATNETGFKIEWKTAGGTYAQLATVGANVTNYNDTGLAAGTTYYYRVRATNAAGDSPYSNETNATTSTIRPAITAQRASASMTIDGNLSEAGWVITNAVTKPIVGTPNNTVTFGVLWDDTYLYVGAKVLDANLFSDSAPYPWLDDSIEIYIDGNHNRGTSYDSYDRQIVKGYNTGTIWVNANQTNGIRHAWAPITGGYSVEVAIPWSNLGITATNGSIIGFDVANNDDDNGGDRESQVIWAGTANNWTDTSAFGDLTLAGTNSRPVTTAQRASAMTIDGNLSEAGWSITNTVTRTIIGTDNNTVTFGALWDDTYLYVGARVLDANLFNDSAPYPWQDDSIEIYIDGNHNCGTNYDAYDRQIVKGWNNPTVWANGNQTNGILHAWATITGGYSVEVAIPWSNLGITPTNGTVIGFDIANDDDDNGVDREGQSMWAGTANNWTDTSAFGDLTLAGTNGPTGEFTNDVNTIALYHFNGNYNDSSTNGFNLTTSGNVTLTSNPGWGSAARFSDLGDQLVISTVADSVVEPGPNQTPLTIEARIYVRGYKAYNRTNISLIGLWQDYNSSFELYDPMYPASGQPIGPFVAGGSSIYIVTASQWQNAVSLNAWHKFKLTVAADGTAKCYVDDNLLATVATSMLVWPTGPWTITLGNFDGDLDEVRISNVVR